VKRLLNSVCVFFRYVGTSLVTALIDYMVFFILNGFIDHLLLTVFLARGVAIIYNFFVIKGIVFQAADKHFWHYFLPYLLLVFFSGWLASKIIVLLDTRVMDNLILSKMSAELLLYFPNYLIMRHIIFKSSAERGV
jgi:putative flippase GtrA